MCAAFKTQIHKILMPSKANGIESTESTKNNNNSNQRLRERPTIHKIHTYARTRTQLNFDRLHWTSKKNSQRNVMRCDARFVWLYEFSFDFILFLFHQKWLCIHLDWFDLVWLLFGCVVLAHCYYYYYCFVAVEFPMCKCNHGHIVWRWNNPRSVTFVDFIRNCLFVCFCLF